MNNYIINDLSLPEMLLYTLNIYLNYIQVSDLLTVLTFLEAQDPNNKETWRSRFVLLLWLSIVVIIPFHMSRLDGFAPEQPGKQCF